MPLMNTKMKKVKRNDKGEYMRMARNSAKLSAAQLSVMSGVPVCTIRSLECKVSRSGRIDTLELLADALGISIDEYVGHKVMVKNHA